MYSYHSSKREFNIAFRISFVKSDVELSLKAQSDCWLSVSGGDRPL